MMNTFFDIILHRTIQIM